MNREEIDKEVEEEFKKYMKTKKNTTKKKFEIDWYKFLAIIVMAVGILSTIYFMISIFTS